MLIQKDRVQALLKEDAHRFCLDIQETLPSTNTALLARAKEGALSGSVLFAHHQTQGRGTRGRSWQTLPDASLPFSLLWRFGDKTPLSGLSLCVGVAIVSALTRLGFSGVGLKWPNDVLFLGRKLAGILIELHQEPDARTNVAVIGIGVNLKLPPKIEASTPHLLPTALSEIANASHPTGNHVFAQMLCSLAWHLDRFSEAGFFPFRETWQSLHLWQNHPVRLVSGHQPDLFGLCKGVNEEGALLLETTEGLQVVVAGDVSLRAHE